MTTVIKVNLNDLNSRFIQNMKRKFGKTAQVEIHVRDASPIDELLPEEVFWQIIDSIDWSKKTSKDKLEPAITMLSEMPTSSIYLFADKLSEKLYLLDTRRHAQAYSRNEEDETLSADDFLYARCAVIAEGKEYYEKVLNTPSEMPNEIVFEPLLNLADYAYKLKMDSEFNYRPVYNYETQSNQSGWTFLAGENSNSLFGEIKFLNPEITGRNV